MPMRRCEPSECPWGWITDWSWVNEIWPERIYPSYEEPIVAGEFLRRREKPEAGKGKIVRCKVDPGDVELYPALVDFLTANEWPDGGLRQRGTLMVFVDQDRFKACLSDKDQGLVLFVTVDALTLVLEACEDAVKDPDADWRASKPTGRK